MEITSIFLAIVKFKDSGNVQVKPFLTFDSAVEYIRKRIVYLQKYYYTCCEINTDNLTEDLDFEFVLDSKVVKFCIKENTIGNDEDCLEIKAEANK